jgi:hypothetical protein
LSGNEISSYCRDIETYLCRKNDGHLIRVVGPSFEVVARWAEAGVPLKVAFRGIDRYFERYYRNGPRRRPVKIDFCEADVLDVFDEWRRAIGLTTARPEEPSPPGEQPEHNAPVPGGRTPSLPAHLERVLLRLTSARVNGTLGPSADTLLDRVSAELDAARASAGGLRGERRRALLNRLAEIDRELLDLAGRSLNDDARGALLREADEELAGFKAQMPADAYERARKAAFERLLRDRSGLPTVALT